MRTWKHPELAYVRRHFDGIRWVAAYEDGLWVSVKAEGDTEEEAKGKVLQALEKGLKETRDAFKD